MKNEFVYLISYRDSMNRPKHIAVYTDDRREALRQFHKTCEATDRITEERKLTADQYREWKKSI